MKTIRTLLLAASALAAVALFGPQLIAQDNAPASALVDVTNSAPATVAPVPVAQPELPAAAKGIIEGLVVKFPWVSTVLSIYAAAAIGWQILCGAAHNWAARTSDLRDNAWLAKLETLWWFRWADKFFYFGGYFGSWAGGKKL